MAVNLSSLAGVAWQFFDNSGSPLSGGLVYTYDAGTSTPATTYTSISGIIAHSNPIVLDAAGRVPGGEIWLVEAAQYKFVIKDSVGVQIGSYDNVTGYISSSIPSTITVDRFSGDGTQVAFVLSTAPGGIANTQVYINGVYQDKNTYGLAGVTLTFTAAPPVGSDIEVIIFATLTVGLADAANVTYNEGGIGAVMTSVQAKLQETVSVKDFGAVGDGVADDTVAIQAALDSGAKSVFFPNGTYKTTDSINIDGKIVVYGEGYFGEGSTISPISSVLEAVKIGSNALFSGAISYLNVNRVTYSGATENIGFALYNVANGLFENLFSNANKYNFYIKPQNSQRVAYSQFINCVASGGYWNWAGALTGTGYSNENILLGCRFITSENTDTQFRLNWGGNFFRFIGCSMEGTAAYGLYFNLDGGGAFYGHSLFVENCRFEGTFSTAKIYLGGNAEFCTINQHDFYGTSGIVDDGKNNYVIAGWSSYLNRDVSSRTNPVLIVSDKYSSSGNSNAIQILSGRVSGKAIEVVYDGTGDVMGGMKMLNNSISFTTNKSDWVSQPIVLGGYYFWVDVSGRLRIKNGVPISENDGTIVGTQS